MISKLEQPKESKEFRFTISEDDFGKYGRDVLLELEKKVLQQNDWEVVSPNHEGLRVRCTVPNEHGWFLLRMSLHDPVMPLNIESDVKGGVKTIAKKLDNLLDDFQGLKTDALKK